MSESTPSSSAPAETAAASAGGAEQLAPEFQQLDASQTGEAAGGFQIDRFGGVQVVLTAELGRVKVTLQELMDLSEGSVLDLKRAISAPVELVAQGVPLGNAEVVVVDDQFAVRIKEIYQSR